MNNRFTIYNLKLANQLIKKGYKMLGYNINVKYPKYYCYYFEDSAELRQEVINYKKFGI